MTNSKNNPLPYTAVGPRPGRHSGLQYNKMVLRVHCPRNTATCAVTQQLAGPWRVGPGKRPAYMYWHGGKNVPAELEASFSCAPWQAAQPAHAALPAQAVRASKAAPCMRALAWPPSRRHGRQWHCGAALGGTRRRQRSILQLHRDVELSST